MAIFSDERGDFRFSEDARYREQDKTGESIRDTILNNPMMYAMQAIEYGDASDSLYAIMGWALDSNMPIDERFFEIKTICEDIIEAYAKSRPTGA